MDGYASAHCKYSMRRKTCMCDNTYGFFYTIFFLIEDSEPKRRVLVPYSKCVCIMDHFLGLFNICERHF